MNPVTPLRAVLSLFCAVGLAASPLLATGVIRNAPTLKGSIPLPEIDLDDPAGVRVINLAERFEFPAISGDYAKVATPFGDVYLEFLPADAPDTVANFKSYLATDATSAADLIKTYDGVFVHRSVKDFVVQTGGYKLASPLSLLTVTKKAAVKNEFKVANTRGTLAMAKLGGQPDSATNEWFVNLSDNRANLDNQNGGFTVFARVLGDGMKAFDRIAAIKAYDVDGSESNFDQVPLRNYRGGDLALSYFIFFPTLRAVDAASVPAEAKTTAVTYSILGNDNPSAAVATLKDGVLKIAPGKFGGRALITVRASAASGHYADEVVTVTRDGPPRVVKQLPAATKAALGSTFTLNADITAWPFAIKWQRRADASSPWTDLAESSDEAPTPFSGVRTETLTVRLDGEDANEVGAALALTGSQFRFVLANTDAFAAPSVDGAPTTLTVTTTLAFAGKLAPKTTAALGSTFSLSAPALGGTYPAPSYQWQRKAPGGEWIDLVDLKDAVKGSGTNDNPEFPSVHSAFSGVKTATLVVRLTGPESPAATSTAISTLDTLALHQNQFRCILSHDRGEGVVSLPGAPTTLAITTVPVGVAAQPAKLFYGFLSHVEGDTTNKTTLSVSAKAAASNTPVKYQWQRLNPATGQWENLVNHVAPVAATDTTPASPGAPTPYSGVTTATLTVRLPSDANTAVGYGLNLDGAQYRCVLGNVLKNASAPFGPAAGEAVSSVSTLRIISGALYLATDNDFVFPGTFAPSVGRSYAAKGLPAGLSIDPATGRITGVSTAKPGIYKVSVTTSDGASNLTTVYYVEIRALGGGTVHEFEALLSPANGVHLAKVTLTISGTGGLTGKLETAFETKPLAFRGTVSRDYQTGVVSFKTPVVIARPGSPAGRAYVLTGFSLATDGYLSVKLSTRETATAAPVEIASAVYVSDEEDDAYPGNPGREIGVYSTTSPAPWANVGAYNLAITAPAPLDAESDDDRPIPAGSGYALAPSLANGRLNFKGKLADGAVLTASVRGSYDKSFRLFARPYGAASGAVLSAELPMHIPNIFYPRHSVSGDAGKDAYWTKPELTGSANYRAGFGPLGLSMRLEPWFPSYFTDFGFAEDTASGKGKTELVLSGANLGASAASLPAAFGVAYQVPVAPFTDFAVSNPSQFKGTLDTRNGFFKGSFKLVDGAITRTVPFEGTLLMSEDLKAGTITAEGFTLVPPLSGGAEATVSGRIQFKNPAAP